MMFREAQGVRGEGYRLDGNSLPYLPDFDPTGQSSATFGVKPDQGPDLAEMERNYEKQQVECTLRSWEIAGPPPTFAEGEPVVDREGTERSAEKPPWSSTPTSNQGTKPELSQIIGPTPRNTHGFKYSQKRKSTSVQHEAQYMSTMSLEVHANTRGKLVPNPEQRRGPVHLLVPEVRRAVPVQQPVRRRHHLGHCRPLRRRPPRQADPAPRPRSR